MFELSQAFHRARQRRNQAPTVLLTLVNGFGARVYSNRQPSAEQVGLTAPPVADGTFLADGARQAGGGSLNVLDFGARVLSFGRLRETLNPIKNDLVASLDASEPASVTVVLNNEGAKGARPFSRMEALENILGATAKLTLGYAEILPREYLERFAGRVESYSLEAEKLSLTLRA